MTDTGQITFQQMMEARDELARHVTEATLEFTQRTGIEVTGFDVQVARNLDNGIQIYYVSLNIKFPDAGR